MGRYLAGACFVHFCATPALWGLILWGRPDAAVARQVGRSLVLELEPPAVRHASLIDASRLEGSDAGSFRRLERYMTDFAEPLARQVSRLALVRPSGLSGAMVAGVYEVVPRPYPVQLFDGLAAAVGWLGAEGELGAPATDVVRTVTELYEEAIDATPMVSRLRSWLEATLTGVDLAAAAKALGTSERSLQRRLREAETSFSTELGAARVRVAQRLLLSGDAPLTEIALEVGCASLQHFGVLFRKTTGESPSAWRERERAAARARGPRR